MLHISLQEANKRILAANKKWRKTKDQFLFIGGYLFTGLFGRFMGNDLKTLKQPNAIWLVVTSTNNINSIKFLLEALPNSMLVATSLKKKYNGKLISSIPFYNGVKFLRKFYPIYKMYKKEIGGYAKVVRHKIFFSIGAYETALQVLKLNKPKALILANDQNIRSKALICAAKELSIPTIYLPHGDMNKYSPPLSCDLNLLYGAYSKDKYLEIGSANGEVELIGIPKMDNVIGDYNKRNTVNGICICSNIIDDAQETEQLLQNLVVDFPEMDFGFRMHPRDGRTFSIPNKVVLSDPNKEHITTFLGKYDMLIASTTSTHVEAVTLNLVSLTYNLNHQIDLDDYYDYVKNGLTVYTKNYEHLKEKINLNIKRKDDVRINAQYYNAAIETDFEGKSSELAVQKIKSFLNL